VCEPTGAMVTETDLLGDALARAIAGDEAGFLQLWRSLQPRLLRFLRVLGSDDPEDVASETWLQVVRDLCMFSGSADDFRRWLFTIGRNRAIDAARARSRRPARAASAGLDILADTHVVEDEVLDGISAEQAVTMLRRLSRDQAEAVALRVLAGLDTPDVAKILGKSSGAVRVALHRGLRTLADDPVVRELALRGGRALGGARPVTAHAGTEDAPMVERDGAGAITQPSPVLPPGSRPLSDAGVWMPKEVDRWPQT
jgi:RNA polymerase sigma-70 factor, ECF subfamily